MADLMRPVPFTELLERIVGELSAHGSVFGVDKKQFYHDKGNKKIKVFTQECSTPVGPAAGPHSQLAQNIITSYLCGARFIELKTVQIMDHLEIAKPCIDARDEGHNTEWSTEYTLEKAYDEYLKAWIILHIIEAAMKEEKIKTPSFIFNMSVGYNLEGIKQPKMQTYIDSMIDAAKKAEFREYIEEAKAMLKDGLFEGTPWAGREDLALETLDVISANISPSVTISTMHGCPPKEIEAICTYMLTEKHLNTFVKLNPTLLGYDTVRGILDSLGFNKVVLKRESFEHDLQLADAKAMLHRLVDLAKEKGLGFGVKLTNTLGNVNNGGVLPGDERYMSGRALLPISTRVALILSEEFDGKLPISYSGGASALSISDIFNAGIHPITVATDMLKPGGYARLAQMAEILRGQDGGWNSDVVDISKLKALIEKASKSDGISSKEWRGSYKAKIGDALELFDCYVAPCVASCPIHQQIPDYIALAAEGREAEALALIYMDNALPNITGWICDHQCQNHCSRLDYEGPVQIREVKRLLAEGYFDEFKKEIWEGKKESGDVKAAVIGAGPAGLAAAYFLARAGIDVTVFEKEGRAGGVVANIIPEFRIPLEAVDRDIAFIEEVGAKFVFNADKTVTELKSEGYEYVFVSVGADKSNNPGVSGNGERKSAIRFLYEAKHGSAPELGRDVVVVGGGNTAMDAARMAKRTQGVENVSVVYRRSIEEMPADIEEYKMALSDGIRFYFLSNPKDLTDGVLTVSEMELGEADSSGRRRPVDTGRAFTLPCSYLISAIGEKADPELLKSIGAEGDDVYIIGDTATGPSTVVRCIRSAKDAVESVIDKLYDDAEDAELETEASLEEACGGRDISDEELLEAEDSFFEGIREKKSRITLSLKSGDKDFFKREASRCNECSYLCNKCVEVCPNRANVSLDLRDTGLFDDPFQVLHLDAYCNECGNCETFCPHDGGPYKKKFTLFSRADDFENSTNSGFLVEEDRVTIRLNGKVIKGRVGSSGVIADVPDQVKAVIDEVFISYPYLLGPVEE